MGNNSSLNQKKLNEEYRKMVHTYWLFCPRCYHISSVKPIILKDELYISLYCKCLYDERQFMKFDEFMQLIREKKTINDFCKKHKNSIGFLYCIFCEKWLCDDCFLYHKENYPLHLLSDIPIKLKEYCFKHDKDLAIAYCKTCEKNICLVCLRDKQKLRHDIIILNNQKYEENINKMWDTFLEKQPLHIAKNSQLKDEMIKIINDNKDLVEAEKKKFIEKINIYYNKNKKINDKLNEYILLLFSNFEYAFRLSKIPNHNICYNLINLKFNNPNFEIKDIFSIELNIEKLIGYYNDIHLVRMMPLVCLKNISLERQNVTNQIAKNVLLDENTVATLISKGIVIIWNYMTYEELYRIKKITVDEKKINEKNIKNINNTSNENINDNIQNFFLEEDLVEDLNIHFLNNNVVQQQFDILNQIQGNIQNNILNLNSEIKKVNILKVYHVKQFNVNLNLSDINLDLISQNELNRINSGVKIEEEEPEDEEDLDQNFNFTSIAFIKKYGILALIIENYNEIYLFDVKTEQALPEKLIGHKKEVLEIISLKNSDLASYGRDHTIRIWNMKHFQNVTILYVEIKKHYIYFTQLLHGNLIFATDNNTIKMVKFPEYEFLPKINVVSPPINYFELPDRRLIISSEDYLIRIYEPPDYTKCVVLSKSRQKIYSFILLDLNRLLIGIEDNGAHSLNIFNWRGKGDKLERKILGDLGFKSPIGSIVKTKNKRIITVSWDNLIKVFLVGN